MNIKNLFGSFAPRIDQERAAQDPLFNRREAGWNAAGGALQGLGLGLMTGDWARAMEVNNSAVDDYRKRKTQQFTAQQLMEEAAARKQEREAKAAELERKNNWLKSISDPQMRATLEANPGLIEDYIKATDPTFQTADAGGEDGVYGTVHVDRNTGERWVLSKDGRWIKPEGLPEGADLYDPYSTAEARAQGSLVGGAPEKIVDEYSKKTRGEISALSDTVMSVREARKFLERGIQTGSMSEALQGLRSLGAQLGFNVDESVLSNTQTYQNFIGNVVIPRMAALGGNDSNEELRRLLSLSGGDITQSLSALNNTLDFLDRLFTRKYRSLKSVEDVALQFLPGLEPVPFGGGEPSGDGAGGMPDFSKMTDEELEALAND